MAQPIVTGPTVNAIAAELDCGDPYAAAVGIIALAVELAVGKHSGQMSQGEYDTLVLLALKLGDRDQGVVIRPTQSA